jgi:8-oxo-dGTP pyrophosphatase MutT (NUDIX family)
MKKAAGILVVYNNKCLLCKRNTEGSLPGEWSVPAGKIEPREGVISAAHREFFEETNINIDGQLNFMGVLKRYNREGIKPKGLLYIFKYDSDEELLPDLDLAVDGDEHTECSYFGKNELPLPMGENFRSLISKYLY